MNKEELLQEVNNKIATGELSREELLARLGLPTVVSGAVEQKTPESNHFFGNNILYVLGGAIAVIGIIVFVSQIWTDIGSMGRIAITLGLGLLFAVLGSVLFATNQDSNLGSVFHFIGGVMIPGGAMVTLSELQVGSGNPWALVVTFGMISLFYVLLTAIHKKPILTFFTIANATFFLLACIDALLPKSYYYSYDDVYAYVYMTIGVSYLLLAVSFRNTWNAPLISALCLFGSSFFLGATFSRVFDSVFWQMAYFLIVIGGIFLSAYLKSRSILTISTIFLIVHTSYITGKYFADSIGWPVTLVALGFIFIVLGYVSVGINKKYITHS